MTIGQNVRHPASEDQGYPGIGKVLTEPFVAEKGTYKGETVVSTSWPSCVAGAGYDMDAIDSVDIPVDQLIVC